jgi:hypothetical protein
MAGTLPDINCVETRPCLASSRFHQKSQSSGLCAQFALRPFAKPIELTAEGVIFRGMALLYNSNPVPCSL